jgi:metal-sulfur cluster biosynthetic enzyme
MTTTDPSAAPADAGSPGIDEIWRVLATILDPEFGINLVDLGLIYDVTIDGADVRIAMTLTSAGCPAGEMMLDGVQRAVEGMPGVGTVRVDLVWEPAWTPGMLSAEARAQLGWKE